MLNSSVCYEESGRNKRFELSGWWVGHYCVDEKMSPAFTSDFNLVVGDHSYSRSWAAYDLLRYGILRGALEFLQHSCILNFFIHFFCQKCWVWVLPPEKWTSDHIRRFSVRRTGCFFLVLSLLSLASGLPAALLSRLFLVPVPLTLNVVKKVQFREWRIKSSAISSKCSVIGVVKKVRLN